MSARSKPLEVSDEGKVKPQVEDLGTCANCDQPAVVATDGRVANRVAFCKRHRPDNL